MLNFLADGTRPSARAKIVEMKKKYVSPEVEKINVHLDGMLMDMSFTEEPGEPAANEYREVEGEKRGSGNIWDQAW